MFASRECNMLCFMLAAFVCVSWAANFAAFLSPNGSDGNPCTPQLPCYSIARVVNETIFTTPPFVNVTVHLAPGAYSMIPLPFLGLSVSLGPQGTFSLLGPASTGKAVLDYGNRFLPLHVKGSVVVSGNVVFNNSVSGTLNQVAPGPTSFTELSSGVRWENSGRAVEVNVESGAYTAVIRDVSVFNGQEGPVLWFTYLGNLPAITSAALSATNVSFVQTTDVTDASTPLFHWEIPGADVRVANMHFEECGQPLVLAAGRVTVQQLSMHRVSLAAVNPTFGALAGGHFTLLDSFFNEVKCSGAYCDDVFLVPIAAENGNVTLQHNVFQNCSHVGVVQVATNPSTATDTGSHVLIQDNVFQTNEALGAALQVDALCNLGVLGNTFFSNVARCSSDDDDGSCSGGAMSIQGQGSGGGDGDSSGVGCANTIRVCNNTWISNASPMHGGHLSVFGVKPMNVSLTDNVFTQGLAGISGGAVSINASSTLLVQGGNRFSDNSAPRYADISCDQATLSAASAVPGTLGQSVECDACAVYVDHQESACPKPHHGDFCHTRKCKTIVIAVSASAGVFIFVLVIGLVVCLRRSKRLRYMPLQES